ncbi:MAG: sensor histidine kinase [Syntrophales bacterium]
MKKSGNASRQEMIRKQVEEFDATLTTELIPGIIHNFANPLNGIMGRATLMQRRTAEQVRKIQDLYPEMPSETVAGLNKILQDADSIVRESDRFFSIFRDLTTKFSALVPREEEKINLSHLISNEMRFADFYLDFKHEVSKTLLLDDKLPEIRGVYAIYSLCFAALLRRAMRVMKASPKKEFSVATGRRDSVVIVTIKDTGEPLTSGGGSERHEEALPPSAADGSKRTDPELFEVIALLSDCGARVQLRREGGINSIAIEIPMAG